MNEKKTGTGFRADSRVCGGDIELGNFVLGLGDRETGALASRLLLGKVDGVAVQSWAARQAAAAGGGDARIDLQGSSADVPNPQDWGRRYLPANGGCVYIDLDHLEVCLPEVVGARDHTAAWFAMLRIVREAQVAANRGLPTADAVRVLVNNSDGLDHAYGSHLNFQLPRRVWHDLFRRRLHHLMYLASYQASSLVFTGAGKVGSENGRPRVDFQISQRADFFETLTGMQTTFNRPLCNSRDEALCGGLGHPVHGLVDPEAGLARLHVIFYDSNLCPMAHYLKIGVMQVMLALIESGRVDPGLALDDPVAAVHRWSHDPGLTARAPLLSGEPVTALELQRRFLDAAERFAAEDERIALVPEADTILQEWARTLDLLEARDPEPVARRVDWALKRLILERVLSQHPELDWTSPELKHLDQIYASLDPDEGLYWAYARRGFVEPVVDEAEIEAFLTGPPENTRAWTRAMLLRRLGTSAVDHLDWDHVRLRTRDAWGLHRYHRIDMDDPTSLTRSEAGARLEAVRSVEDVIAVFDAVEVDRYGRKLERSWS